MSSTTSDQRLIDARATLPEPHFDEEATVLSARPVVPLDEVRSSAARNFVARPWVLGLGLAGALLIGVFATALFYSKSNEDNSRLFEHVEVASGVEGNSEESADSFSGPVSPQPKIDTPVAIPEPASANTRAGKANSETTRKPRLVAVIRERNSNDHVEEDGENDEELRSARRQARRERRRTERERRDGQTADDLMRIRDIFEGSPRP